MNFVRVHPCILLANTSLSEVDHTYITLTFIELIWSTIFVLNGLLFEDAVRIVYAIHEIDNRSDHDPVFMHLATNMVQLATTPRLFAPKAARSKASVADKGLIYGGLTYQYCRSNSTIRSFIMSKYLLLWSQSHKESLDMYF
jgi:hypothetical protein